jgi:dienelactone hydrolase
MLGLRTKFAAMVLGAALMGSAPAEETGRVVLADPIALTNGVHGIPVKVQSRSPGDYRDIFEGKLGPAVELTAQLFLPPGGQGHKAPAVIMVPGSGGVDAQHLIHSVSLTTAGIAVLLIDPFQGRGIADTMANQGQLSFAASAYDVFASVLALRRMSQIDPARIGAFGGSRGGTAVMMAAAAPLSRAVLGKAPGLKAVVAGYPWCGMQFHAPRLAEGAALLVMQGDRDNWTSFLQCQDAVHALEATKSDARMMLFPGARHAFDRTDIPPTEIADAVTSTIFPTLYLDDRGRYFDLRTDRVDPALTGKNFMDYAVSGGFHHKGVAIGATGNQAVEFSAEMLSFLTSHLKN